MAIAYVVNTYPRPSHSFIRREIAALEQLGVPVHRFTIRREQDDLPDVADREEQARTRAILEAPAYEIARAVLSTLSQKPGAFLKAARLAWQLGKASDRGRLYHLFYLGEACVLKQWLSDAKVNHVHAHFGTNSTCVALLCHELGGPKYSFTVHGPDEFDRPGLLGLAAKVAKAEFVVGISKFGKSQLMRWARFADWKKIHIVHCGVDDKYLAMDPTSVPKAPRLVCVGRLANAKGQALLIEAAARLKREGLEFQIVLAGNGPLQKELEQLVRELDVTDRVELRGWVSNDDVRELLQGSRALVLPSFAEGLPVAVMEAFAMGRPVVASRIAGMPELVEHRVSGWLIDAGSVESLTNAIRDVLRTTPEALTQMGRVGRRRVEAQHDALKEAKKLLRLMKQPTPLDAQRRKAPRAKTRIDSTPPSRDFVAGLG
jgi:glycosyltransferase involved in cell wall biosynthesis